MVPMNRDLYAMSETAPTKSGMVKIDPRDAARRNEAGFGIFWTVNQFKGRRIKDNLVRINSWFVDLDEGTKAEQLALIHDCLVPSMIIESKRGFHVYWDARDADIAQWGEIMSRILFWFGGDENAKDVTRVLRAPGYKHWKDEEDPFVVRVVWAYPVKYTMRQMLYWFPQAPHQAEKEIRTERKAKIKASTSSDVWQRIFDLDCEEALLRFSGTTWVNGELYHFRDAGNGNKNIWVNGKQTSCFIDQDKRIGSMSKGGPTIFAWLKWFGWTNRDVMTALRQRIPELFPKDGAK